MVYINQKLANFKIRNGGCNINTVNNCANESAERRVTTSKPVVISVMEVPNVDVRSDLLSGVGGHSKVNVDGFLVALPVLLRVLETVNERSDFSCPESAKLIGGAR